jgi:hypothetical protein
LEGNHRDEKERRNVTAHKPIRKVSKKLYFSSVLHTLLYMKTEKSPKENKTYDMTIQEVKVASIQYLVVLKD